MRLHEINNKNRFYYGGQLKNLKFESDQRFPPIPLVFLDLGSPVIIEKEVTFASGVRIYTHTHDFKKANWRALGAIKDSGKPFVLRKGCFIGSNVLLIWPCKYVGKYSVVGAGSVVIKDIPDYEIWAGNPAKKIRDVEKVNE